MRHLPDPSVPVPPAHAHCDACLIAPSALPQPELVLQGPRAFALAWAAATARQPAPPTLPPEQARAPPIA